MFQVDPHPLRGPTAQGGATGAQQSRTHSRSHRRQVNNNINNNNDNNINRSQQGEDGWTEVRNRRRRVIGKATSTTGNHSHGLRGAIQPPTREIFLSRVILGDRQSITNYMEKRGVKVYHIEKMSHYQASFMSFKVKISVFDKDKVLNENFWPYGVQCMMWKNARQNNTRNNNENNDNYSRNNQ